MARVQDMNGSIDRSTHLAQLGQDLQSHCAWGDQARLGIDGKIFSPTVHETKLD